MSSILDRDTLRSRLEFLMTGIIPLPPSASNTGDTCPICHDLLEHDAVRIISCGHVYHCTCLLRWLQGNDRRNRTCPTCRTELYREAPEVARRTAHELVVRRINHTAGRQPHPYPSLPQPVSNGAQDGGNGHDTGRDLERRQLRERLERRQRHQRGFAERFDLYQRERDAQHERHLSERRQQRERERLMIGTAVERREGVEEQVAPASTPAPTDARAQRLARRNHQREAAGQLAQ